MIVAVDNDDDDDDYDFDNAHKIGISTTMVVVNHIEKTGLSRDWFFKSRISLGPSSLKAIINDLDVWLG